MVEQTQPGNPHQLAVEPHVFPAASIARFADARGQVEVCNLATGKRKRIGPKGRVFRAQRAWDHKSERGYMQEIDSRFQALAARVLSDVNLALTPADVVDINRFWALWWHRSRRRTLADEFIALKGVSPGQTYTKDEQEQLERLGIVYVNSDCAIPARRINGAQMLMLVQRMALEAMEGLKWGIVRPVEGEFLVPDVPQFHLLPITPTLALAAPTRNGVITIENLAKLNGQMLGECRDYFFARACSRCPVTPPQRGTP